MDFSEQIDHLDDVLLSQVETEFPDSLTPPEKTVTHAYLVLAHAVIEEQLELVFTEYVSRLVRWSTSTIVPMEFARFAFAVGNWLPEKSGVSYKKRSFVGVLGSGPANDEFARVIRKNNGVSPDNVQELAKLTGLDWPSFEQQLSDAIEDLRTLTAKRGEAGHLSPFTANSTGLTWQDYPENVREWVRGGRDAVLAIHGHLHTSFYQG